MKTIKGSDLIDMGIYKDSNGFLIGTGFSYNVNETLTNIIRIDLSKLKRELQKIEKELSKCRTSVMQDGWQTMKYAKKARKWDYYAQEKMRILNLIDEYEAGTNTGNI